MPSQYFPAGVCLLVKYWAKNRPLDSIFKVDIFHILYTMAVFTRSVYSGQMDSFSPVAGSLVDIRAGHSAAEVFDGCTETLEPGRAR
jgi:hypothetical protein